MSLGTRVRERREAIGMTQQDVAEKTGIQQTLISRIERGVNANPHADVLLRLARALHCSIDWLVGLYDEDPSLAAVGN
jgi:transcriptional regulator with XRE-family HTH domain